MIRKKWLIDCLGSQAGIAVYFAFTLHRFKIANRDFAFDVMREVSDEKQDKRQRDAINKVF
jgi:hypothetical protein